MSLQRGTRGNDSAQPVITADYPPKDKESIEEQDDDDLGQGDHREDDSHHHPEVGEKDKAEPREEEVPEETRGSGLELDHEEGDDRVQDGLEGDVWDLDEGLNIRGGGCVGDNQV